MKDAKQTGGMQYRVTVDGQEITVTQALYVLPDGTYYCTDCGPMKNPANEGILEGFEDAHPDLVKGN